MGNPHKHAELIKAWADGAEIEVYSLSGECWYPVDPPLWDSLSQYRIKPELKKVMVYLYTNGNRYEAHAGVAPSKDGRYPSNYHWKHVNTFEHIVEE